MILSEGSSESDTPLAQKSLKPLFLNVFAVLQQAPTITKLEVTALVRTK